MSNYIVMNGTVAISAPMSHDEAVERLRAFHDVNLYLNATVVPTDASAPDVGFVATGDAEVVEDVGCAGGACTL